MADEFVQSIKFKADDSDVKRSLSDIEKRAGSIQIRLKPDPSAARIFSQLNNFRNAQATGSTGGLSSLIREQRHAAKSANALAVSLDSARRGLETFALKLSKVGAVSRTSANVATVQGGTAANLGLPFGRIGGFAMVLPGLSMMARAAYAPLKAFSQGSINLFNTQNRAEQLLKFGMQRNGTADKFQQLKDYASGLQSRTIYGDEALLAAAGGWQNRIKGVENSKRMMELVADYAAKSTGGGAVSAEQMRGFSQQLIQAISGRAVSLRSQGYDTTAIEQLQEARRKGVNVTESMEIAALEKVLSSVKGAAQELAKTDEGKIIKTTNAIGDLREEVGRRLQPVFGRVAASITANLPTIERTFNTFGGTVEKFGLVLANNANVLANVSEKGVKILEVLAEFPAAFASFAISAKVASAAIGLQSAGGAATGLIGSLGGLGGSLTKLATSSAWGLLAGEIALLGSTIYQAYTESKKSKENIKREMQDRKVRLGVIDSFKRYKEGITSEEKYKEVFNVAKKMGVDLSGSYYDIWQSQGSQKTGFGGSSGFDKLLAALKNSKSVTNNKITVNNNIKADSEMTAKIIKEEIRKFSTSQLNFTSRTAAAKALAL